MQYTDKAWVNAANCKSPPATPVAQTDQGPEFIPESLQPGWESSPNNNVSSLDVVHASIRAIALLALF